MSTEHPAEGTIANLHDVDCTSYQPGHNVHWIQALITGNRREVFELSWHGRLTSVDGELLTVRSEDGAIHQLRNHDPQRLQGIVDLVGDAVLVNDQFAILRARTYCFSVAKDIGEPLRVCPTNAQPSRMTVDEMADRALTHGGVSIPFRAIVNPSGKV